jgi:hypothetical protein
MTTTNQIRSNAVPVFFKKKEDLLKRTLTNLLC